MSNKDPKNNKKITSAETTIENAGETKPLIEADLYNEALQILEANTDKIELYRKAKGLLEQILDYKDSAKLLEKCTDKISSLTIAQNEKKRKRNVIITVISVFVGIIAIALLVMSRNATIDSEKQGQYESALRYIERAKNETEISKKNRFYQSAYEILAELGSFNNSDNLIVLTKVEYIKELVDKGLYGDALSLYNSTASKVLDGSNEDINGARDYYYSTIKTRALEAFNSGKYDDAIVLFRYLDNTDDEIVGYIEKCQFNAIKSAAIGDVVKYGAYQITVDNNTFNFDEDINWLVVAKQGNKALLVTQSVILTSKYDNENDSVEWKDSSLRSFLNGEFTKKAFSTIEQSHIVTTDNGGSEDKVFIFSKQEAQQYLGNGLLKTSGTPYAYFKGLEGFESGSEASYWLRDTVDCNAVFVDNNGVIFEGGYIVNHEGVGVRPAIWVSID